MNKHKLLEGNIKNEEGCSDVHTLLAEILLEKNPGLQQFLLGVAQKTKEFIESPQTQEFAKITMLSLQKINQTLSNPDFLEGVSRFLQLPQKRREAILAMSELGWFPFEESIASIPLSMDSIDEYMVSVIKENYEKIKVNILEKYTERKEILECAFRLIEDGNDIAAIPLLLTQIDGISKDVFGMYYFTGSRIPEKKMSLPVHLKNRRGEIGEHAYDLLKSIIEKANDSFISDGFEKLKGEVNSINILNRSGILHGDKDFINYWERPNSYKVLSLLFYVDWISEFIEEE